MAKKKKKSVSRLRMRQETALALEWKAASEGTFKAIRKEIAEDLGKYNENKAKITINALQAIYSQAVLANIEIKTHTDYPELKAGGEKLSDQFQRFLASLGWKALSYHKADQYTEKMDRSLNKTEKKMLREIMATFPNVPKKLLKTLDNTPDMA